MNERVAVKKRPWSSPSISGAESIRHGGTCPTFTNGCDWKNSKQDTDQTVLTIAKVLTKTTNCTFGAKKVVGTTKFFPTLYAGRVPPLSNSVRHHCLYIFPCVIRDTLVELF